MTAPVNPSLQVLADVLARIAGALQRGDEAAARTQVAADVEQLRGLVTHLEVQSSGAPAGFDLAQVADALRLFADWLRAPTRAGEAQAERALTDLQATIGPLVGWDPAREDAERRQQYQQEARTALDDYFRDRPRKS